jgi:DNA-binding HxlR family transcriptional regulator
MILPRKDNSVSDSMVQIMVRIRAILDPLDDGQMDCARHKFFTYISAQLVRFESTRDNPFVSVVDHVGNYWRNWLLMIVRTGPYRPSTIRRLLAALDPSHPISQRMLTLNLRLLERDGLIGRSVLDSERKHVEYSLTPLGRDLSDRIMALIGWINDHSDEIGRARASFDSRNIGAGRY